MAGRTPEVRPKGGYWYSEAGGRARRFGRVDLVSRAEATAALWKALAEDARAGPETNVGGSATKPGVPSPPAVASLTIDALADLFLAWVRTNRGDKAYAERSRHIGRFRERWGKLPADALQGSHVEAFIEALGRSHALDYVNKHVVSLKAMFNQGARKGWIPPTNPFATVDPIRLPPKALTEGDLPTPEEVRRLDQAAVGDIRDMLRLYHATGMRTHELIQARAGDYQPQTKAIVLAKHKRSGTLREYRPRTIALGDEAAEIVAARCQGKGPEDVLFPRPSDGAPHSSVNVAERFQSVRGRAGVRSSITIYSYRHLWISEMLMAGVDALMVARMAGTGVKMIETVYGHFKTSSFREAQARLDAMRNGRDFEGTNSSQGEGPPTS